MNLFFVHIVLCLPYDLLTSGSGLEHTSLIEIRFSHSFLWLLFLQITFRLWMKQNWKKSHQPENRQKLKMLTALAFESSISVQSALFLTARYCSCSTIPSSRALEQAIWTRVIPPSSRKLISTDGCSSKMSARPIWPFKKATASGVVYIYGQEHHFKLKHSLNSKINSSISGKKHTSIISEKISQLT